MTIDIEKLAEENGFIPHEADDGECYADLETLKQFADALLEDKEREIAELKTTVRSDNSKVIAALNARINDLREALEDIAKHTPENFWQNKAAQEALSKTPAQSLQAFENEVIERCAKVCDEYWTNIDCKAAIRALKVSND